MSKATSVKEVLIATKWILENSVKWCQNTYYKMADGDSRYAIRPHEYDKVACACVSGAMLMVDVDQAHLLGDANNAMCDTVPSVIYITEWNDRKGRTKKQVLKMLDRAIAAAEKTNEQR